MECRNCKTELKHCILDLGASPPANAFLTKEDLNKPELWYPLRLFVCDRCFLVQTEDFLGRESLFSPDYVYFSSYSETWLKHAKTYVETVIRRFNLTENSLVVEVASNDGYLLQYVKEHGIPCYGIEPAHLVAEAARSKGIDTVEEFFGAEVAERLVRERGRADLIVANNVLAHVPDINDFVSGFRIMLKPGGVATFEFQYAVKLIENCEFDTIYHEHYSYLTLSSVMEIFANHGLKVFDVEELETHGGSLRIYVRQGDSSTHFVTERVEKLIQEEVSKGIRSLGFYEKLKDSVTRIKIDLLSFLIEKKREGKLVAAYGAAAKGNTLLNYAGIREDLIPFVADRNPVKQGKFLPGSRIPVVSPERLLEEKPNYILIIPWNIKSEIMLQLQEVRSWGGKFIVAVPRLEIF